MTRDCFEKRRHAELILILSVIAYFLLMWGNGIVSLTHPDEVFYVQSAKEMVSHNSWMTPLIFDQPQFEKPVLFFWLLALGIKFFGLTPFIARFWPAFFAMAGVCAAYGTAWMLFRRKRTAFLAGVILASSFIYLAMARAVLTDMVFSVLVTLSITFFCWAYEYRKRKRVGMILCLLFSALAVLTKGILGFTFPAAAILIFLTSKGDLRFLKDWSTLMGLLVFVVVAVPWHVLMYRWYGHAFIEEYFYNVHLKRILIAEHPRLDSWYLYLGIMFGGILPWSLFWVPAGLLISRQFRSKTESRDKLFFLLSWIVGIYMFVQPAHSKLASYIFPVFPAIAVIVAYYLDDALQKAEGTGRSRGLAICGYLSSVFFIGVAAGGIIAGKKYIEVIVHMGPVYIFSVLLSLAGCLIFIFALKRQYLRMIFSHVGVTAILLVTLLFAKPYIEPWVSCEGISAVFNKIDRSDSVVIASKFYVRGIRYYTDRKMAVIDINGKGFFSPHPIPFLNTDEKVLELLGTQAVTYAIVKEGNVKDLKRIIQGHSYRLEELAGMGGKYILKIERLLQRI